MTHSSVLFVARANFAGLFFIASFCVFVIMATNFLELATTVKYLGAKWLLEKKLILCPEHTRNVQIGHRHVLLSSLMFQITATRVNYICKMFQMNRIAKQLIPPNKNVYFHLSFFSGNVNGNIYKFDSLCLYRSIRPLDHGDQIEFGSGLTMMTFARYALVAFGIRK